MIITFIDMVAAKGAVFGLHRAMPNVVQCDVMTRNRLSAIPTRVAPVIRSCWEWGAVGVARKCVWSVGESILVKERADMAWKCCRLRISTAAPHRSRPVWRFAGEERQSGRERWEGGCIRRLDVLPFFHVLSYIVELPPPTEGLNLNLVPHPASHFVMVCFTCLLPGWEIFWDLAGNWNFVHVSPTGSAEQL